MRRFLWVPYSPTHAPFEVILFIISVSFRFFKSYHSSSSYNFIIKGWFFGGGNKEEYILIRKYHDMIPAVGVISHPLGPLRMQRQRSHVNANLFLTKYLFFATGCCTDYLHGVTGGRRLFADEPLGPLSRVGSTRCVITNELSNHFRSKLQFKLPACFCQS